MSPFQFRDCKDRIWDLKLSLKQTMRVDRSDYTAYTDKKLILSKLDRDTITELLTNTSLMFAVIGTICLDQAREYLKCEGEVKYADFEEFFVEGIDGSCIEPARDALVEALGDFFRQAKTVLLNSVQKMKEYQQKAMERVQELQPTIDRKVNELLDREIESIKESIETSSLSPESSGSSPGITLPSESLSSGTMLT